MSNQKVFDNNVRFQVFLERYKNGSVKRLQEFVAELDRELEFKLEKSLQSLSKRDVAALTRGQRASTERLKAFRKLLDDVQRAAGKTLEARLAEEIGPVAVRSAQRQAAIASQIGLQGQVALPTIGSLERLSRLEPFEGRVLKEWAQDWSRARVDRATRQLRIGLAAGESTREIGQRVKREALDISRRGAEMIVRTASTHAAAVGDNEYFAQNKDLIEEVVFTAVLDTRTSDICRINDGRSFKPDNIELIPPLHPGCRSRNIPRYVGQGSVKDQTYFEWLRDQNKARQIEALGPTRRELFVKGELDGKQLIRAATGKPYTLEQLKRREASAFDKIAA